MVAHRGDHRYAQQRDRAAEGLVAEGEQVSEGTAAAGDDHHLDLRDRGQLPERRGDPRRGVAILHRRERPDETARPAAPLQPGEDVVAGLPALTRDHADRPRQQRARQQLLGLEQAVGGEPAPQPLQLHQQVALAGDPELGDREAERRRRGRAAGVVIAAAGDDDPEPIAESHPEGIEIVLPEIHDAAEVFG